MNRVVLDYDDYQSAFMKKINTIRSNPDETNKKTSSSFNFSVSDVVDSTLRNNKDIIDTNNIYISRAKNDLERCNVINSWTNNSFSDQGPKALQDYIRILENQTENLRKENIILRTYYTNTAVSASMYKKRKLDVIEANEPIINVDEYLKSFINYSEKTFKKNK